MSLGQVGYFAPSPSTTRAQGIPLSTDAKGNLLGYPVGNCAVVRNIADPAAPLIVYSKHKSAVTCVRIAPAGDVCASGDKDGNVTIWVLRNLRPILEQKSLGGAVRDIAWSEDGERMIIVGEGRTSFGAVISTSGGNSIGTINGHEKGIYSCDFRKQRPFRVVTGGMDAACAFFEGPPFKFKHTVGGQHTNNVTNVKFSPSGDLIASVSGKNAIVLMDGKTGEFQRAITTSHTGTVFGLSWSPDGSVIATCGADKTVKAHNVESGDQVFSTSFPNSIPFMQQGLVHTAAGVISCGFNGELNILNASSGEVGTTLRGHSRRVVSLHYLPSGQVLSGGSDGSLLLWSEDGQATAIEGNKLEMLSSVAVSATGKTVVAAGGTDLFAVDIAAAKAEPLEKAPTGVVGVAAVAEDAVAVVTKLSIYVLQGGKKVAEEKLAGPGGARFSATAVAASATTGLVVIGGERVVLSFRFTGGALQAATTFANDAHTSDISALTVDRSGTIVASGDTTRNICVWQAEDGKLLHGSELGFHTSKITSLAFGASSADQLVSGSIDNSIIFWDLPNGKKIMQASAHDGGVSALAFHPTLPQIFSSGDDAIIKKWNVE